MLAGREWGIVDSRFGEIVWPPEEGIFLRLIVDKNRFYQEVEAFFRGLVTEQDVRLDEDLVRDLFVYQSLMIIDPFSPKTFKFTLHHNLHEYFLRAYLGKMVPVVKLESTLEVDADTEYEGDVEAYARDVVWYGRKGGRYRHSNVNVISL